MIRERSLGSWRRGTVRSLKAAGAFSFPKTSQRANTRHHQAIASPRLQTIQESLGQ